MRLLRIMLRQTGEGFRSIFRQGWMSFSAILTVAVALMLSSLLFVIIRNVEYISTNLESNLEIVVQLHDDVDKNKIMSKVSAIDNVESVTYKTKDESLASMKEQFGDSEIFDNYTGANNPLKNLLLVKIKDRTQIDQTSNEIRQFSSEVEDLNSGGEETKQLVELFGWVRIGGFILIGISLFVAFVLISNTIRMTIIARQSQIQIMRLVGASNLFIRLPFFFEGILIGVLGAVFPIITVYFGYDYGITKLFGASNFSGTNINNVFLDGAKIFPEVVIVVVSVGVFVGAFASLLSITRYLRH